MLEVKINGKEGIANVQAEGTLPELMSDVTTLLKVMYEGIKEETRQNFKDCVKRLANEELYAKTNKEMDELVKKQKDKVKEKIKKELEDFLNSLFGDK